METKRLLSLRGAALRLCAPQAIRTNRDTGMLRLLALLTMTVDHFGKMLFPQLTLLRCIGRLAFPLFAYGIAVGAAMTRDPIRYLERVVLLALVSQPIYAVALGHECDAMYALSPMEHPLGAAVNFYLQSWMKQPSILLPLSLGLCILLSLRERRFGLAAGCYVLCEIFAGKLDYGIDGIRLMLLFYLLLEHPGWALGIIPAYYVLFYAQGKGYTFFGMSFTRRIFGLPAAILCCLPLRSETRLPKALVYGYYPAHLAVLALLVKCC